MHPDPGQSSCSCTLLPSSLVAPCKKQDVSVFAAVELLPLAKHFIEEVEALPQNLATKPCTHGTGSTTEPCDDVDSLSFLLGGGEGHPGSKLWLESGELEPSRSGKMFLVMACISTVVWAWASRAMEGKGSKMDA